MNAIDNRTTARIASCFAATTLSLASAACSSVTAEPPRAPAAAPMGAAACHATGPAKVLARKVFVPGGVEASEQDGAFSVRYAAAPSHCVAVEWASASEGQTVLCPAPGARTAERAGRDGARLAWEAREESEPPLAAPGVAASDAPRALFGLGIEANPYGAQRTFHAPAAGRGGSDTTPEVAAIGHDRFLLAWVEGGVETHQLRVQSVAGWGDALGDAMDLSPKDASVIGRPSLAVAPTGCGLVTYVASIDGEFDVLATPIACAVN